MLNLNSIMIGSQEPQRLAEFYAKVLERSADMEDEGGWYGWQLGGCYLTIGEHSEVKETAQEPQRIILNFETDKVVEEFERIKELGATVIEEPYAFEEGGEPSIATFADPDGNFFQLMIPMEEGM